MQIFPQKRGRSAPHRAHFFDAYIRYYTFLEGSDKHEAVQVGIVGATGMVGQRFTLLLENHPWFDVVALAASGRNKGKTYAEACEGRWKMTVPMPGKYKDMVMYDATADAEEIASKVDFIFCAVDMKKDEIRALEEKYAKLECPVCSNNSAHRGTPDVPMIIPEINADHAEIIPAQRKRLGTKRGFIAVKSNCSIQSYVPALSALMEFERPRFPSAPIRQSPVPARPLRPGPRW